MRCLRICAVLMLFCAVPALAQMRPRIFYGLAGWWRGAAGLTGGNILYDLSPSKNNMTLNGMSFGTTSGWGPPTRSGSFMQLNFDGTNDYGIVASNSLFNFPDQNFTIHATYRATTAGHIVSKRAAAGGYFIRINAGGTISARIVDGSNLNALERSTNSTNHLDGTWRTITVVFTTYTPTASGNEIAIYVNGVLDQGSSTTSGSGYFTCACALAIGAQSDATSFLVGSIDTVMIWDRALSIPEIEGLYREEPPVLEDLAMVPETALRLFRKPPIIVE